MQTHYEFLMTGTNPGGISNRDPGRVLVPDGVPDKDREAPPGAHRPHPDSRQKHQTSAPALNQEAKP
jgi:hypothetical protein